MTMRTTSIITLALSLLLTLASAFTPTIPFRSTITITPTTPTTMTTTTWSSALSMGKSLVVLSPPGGLGEVAVVKAAAMGGSVKWFVVSGGPGATTDGAAIISFSPETMKQVEAAGGSVELAGADAQSLLDESAIPALKQWCGQADGIICSMDGVYGTKTKDEDPVMIWQNAIKVAAQEASSTVRGMKLAILPAEEDDDDGTGTAAAANKGNIFSNLMGNKERSIPSSLSEALGGKATKLRHGELFGTPESSPNFSAIVGGPRKDAILTEEYFMRSVRMDSSLSVSGNTMMGSTTRSSRHAVGEAAALMVLGKVAIDESSSADVCVSSLPGREPVALEEWQEEFKRVDAMLKAGQGAQLFTTSFTSVPDVERLADWLATKWAPAVLRTYDIAAIRIGARPVYASRSALGEVQIVWQELVDLVSVTAGTMVIQVSETGLTATRGPGDASKGFGAISRKPLNGEDVLVRQLAEAASQAVEKGLAKKAIVVKKVEQAEVKRAEQSSVISPPITSVVSAVTVDVPVTSAESGPRQTGARRSSERTRGSRKRRVDGSGGTSSEDVTNDSSDDDGDAFQ